MSDLMMNALIVSIGVPVLLLIIALLLGVALEATTWIEARRDRRKMGVKT